jgi:hypothetical protein
MQDYDLTTTAGKQAFQRFIIELIRNEVNSYARQVIADRGTTINISDGTSLSDSDRLDRLEQAVFRG